MRRAHIFIGNMPRLLGDILDEVVRSQLDMDVVGRGGQRELSEALERSQLDVVILQENGADSSSASRQLVSAHPGLRVVTIPANGRFATLIELRQLSMMEPSPQMLVQAIRAALAKPGGPG